MCWKKVKCNKKWSQLLISSKCTVNLTLVFYSTYNNYIYAKKISIPKKSTYPHKPMPSADKSISWGKAEFSPSSPSSSGCCTVQVISSLSRYILLRISCRFHAYGRFNFFLEHQKRRVSLFSSGSLRCLDRGKGRETFRGETGLEVQRGNNAGHTLILKELRFLRRSLNLWHLLIYHYAVYFHYICTSNNIVHYFYSGTLCQIANYVISPDAGWSNRGNAAQRTPVHRRPQERISCK